MKFMGYFAPRKLTSRRTNRRQVKSSRNRFTSLRLEPLEERRLLAISSLTVGSPMLFSALAASDGGVDANILEVIDLTIQDGGSINANDDWLGSVPNDDAEPPIVIDASGNFLIEADTAGALDTGIFAENRDQGGFGGNITLMVSGTFTMEDRTTISSSDATIGGNPAKSGDITIDVVGSIDVQTGATIKAGLITTSNGGGGAISIESQADVNMDGSVLSQSRRSGTGASQGPGGGTITIKGTNSLTISDTGIVSSMGQDPGADLVHLEACKVFIYGLVESTGVGHALPNNPPNHLNDHPNHPAQSTAGIEIWAGQLLVIDSTGSHNGEVKADLTGGNGNNTWIDLFAVGDITIVGDTSGPFAVHATNGGNGATGGQINIISTTGSITAGGLAIDASAAGTGFPDGGTIKMQAALNVDLETATLLARGDFVADGGYGGGGEIFVRAYQGLLSWVNGVGDVRPTGIDPPPPPTLTDPGTITLIYNVSINTTGTSFPTGGATPGSLPPIVPFPNIMQDQSPGTPVVPSYVIFTVCRSTQYDFGDAPTSAQSGFVNSYPTLLADNGARHVIVAGFNLGPNIDAEPDGQPSAMADGDDLNGIPDDEDGVTFSSPFVPGLNTSITVSLTGASGFLDAWIDWNADGDWNDPGEQVFTNQLLASGANALIVGVPLNAVVNANGATTFSRFRLNSTMAGVIDPTGEASDGEVEDYKLQIFPYWTSKCAVITQIGDCFAIPDVLVDVDELSASFPDLYHGFAFDFLKVNSLAAATNSIQAAIDYINEFGDINGDGKLLVAVTAKNTTVVSAACGGVPFVGRELGGDGTQNFVITNTRSGQLYVMGNSVTIHAADKNLPVATIKSSVGKVTAMDIHAADSYFAGYLVGGTGQQNASAVLVKNTSATNNTNNQNANGVGIWIKDDNVEVSGSQHLSGNRIGIQIEGDKNVLRTNNEIIKNSVAGIKVVGNNNEVRDQDVGKAGSGNGAGIVVLGNSNKVHESDVLGNIGNGIDVTGNSNVVQKNLVGDKGKGNGGTGIRVAGNLNQILENEIFANLGIGIDLFGNDNLIKKNTVGDSKRGGNGSHGIRVTGKTNSIEENTSNSNGGYGFYIAGSTSTGNKLKNNKSNTEGSGKASENKLAEYKFEAAIVNQGGNKKDNANFASTLAAGYE